MGTAISQGALIAMVCKGLVGFLLLLLWVIPVLSLCRYGFSESSPNSSPGPCPKKVPGPQKLSQEGSYLLQP
ncbi:adropin-like [Fukomys damarensis]|uniref:adropin-like n=1 Tax=Fukomys damarensis TaxID=885580 RepID=UPI00053F3E8E|nr:adropin-like [Fukomys damarensis]